jgi:hypothetical protein
MEVVVALEMRSPLGARIGSDNDGRGTRVAAKALWRGTGERAGWGACRRRPRSG